MAHKLTLALCVLAVLSAGGAYLHQGQSKATTPAQYPLAPEQAPPERRPLAALPDTPAASAEDALPPSPPPAESTLNAEHTVVQAKIAIIIDDIGDQWRAGQQAAELPGQVTLALLPFSPYARQVAALAAQQGKELMLHAPMEPQAHRSWKQGLDTQMDEATLRTALRQMLASVPAAKGVNNHMGSALTENSEAMAWVMDELARHRLYFIDSRTTARSTALDQARRQSLPSAKRDVFLDNTRSTDAIQRQFAKLVLKARQQGSAIAIGHPYPETLAFLRNALTGLSDLGVQLVPASQVLEASPAGTHTSLGDRPARPIGSP